MRNRLLLFFICLPVLVFSQNTGSIQGKIYDRQNGEILGGATVSIKNTKFSVVSDEHGSYEFANLKAGPVILIVSFIGYVNAEQTFTVTGGNTSNADIYLSLSGRVGDAVVVSASRRAEKITNAPASISIIGVKELGQFPGSNVNELLSKVQGIQFTRSGIEEVMINARGFNNAFNNKVLLLVDGRNNMAALSGGLPLLNRNSATKEDLERIEIVLGPQSALYGPNALNAVMNMITKHPRKYSGTTVAVSAGNHYQFSSRLRHAQVINKKWAYKVTGEYATGKEFQIYDSLRAGGPAPTVPPMFGNYGPPVKIAEHNVDFDFKHIRGEGHVYYQLNPKTEIVVSGGGSSTDWLQVTTGGRNQMRGLTYHFLQARLVNPNFYINVYNTWGNIGNSYPTSVYSRDFWNRTHSTVTNPPATKLQDSLYGALPPDSAEMNALRPGNTFKEKSQRTNAEAQYNHNFQKQGLFLVAGLTYQDERPNSYGIALVDKTKKIRVTQYGGVLQLEKTLPFKMRLIGAFRYDHHSNFGNVFAPKLGITKAINNGTFRITWGKAYAMPTLLMQYANLQGSTFGNGPGVIYEPNGYPLETNTKKTTPLKPEQATTWEFGYKGTIAKKLFIDLNYYTGVSKNFLGNTKKVDGRAISVGEFPVTPTNHGTIDANGNLVGASFFTFFNYVSVKSYGIDAGLTYYFNERINLTAGYSWFHSDITKDDLKNDANNDSIVSAEERSMNCPANKVSLALNFQDLFKTRFFSSIALRYVQRYDFYSGNQIGTESGKGTWGEPPRLFDRGPLGGFVSVDLNAGYKINRMAQVALGITNLLNSQQVEFVGSPSIGRLISVELKVHIPDSK